MKKIMAVIISMILAVSLVCGAIPAFAAGTAGNHYNVVLVVDGSGSMTWTDSQNWRYEAINQFVGLLSQQGNCLGAVVFDHEIQVSMDLSAISSRSDKKAITDAIENYEVDKYGDTNIGLALESAVDMLQTGGDSNLPSVIVLLSDGNTDLDEAEAVEVSLEQKADAIDKARDRNIPIYTVCLNEDGSANTSELKQIADATGGNFEEVSNAQDLKNVFQAFYNLIYGTSTIPVIPGTKLDENGMLEADFSVPSVCVQEVNIIIGGNVDSIELIDPDGKALSSSEVEDMTTGSKTFTLVKIVDPKAGNWHIIIHGAPGDTIQIDMVYNSDFRVEFSEQQEIDVPVNTDKTFTTTIYDGDTAVTGKDAYAGFKAEMYVKDANGNLLDTVAMAASDTAFTVDYNFDTIGTYYLSTYVEGQTFTGETDPVMVNVGNTAPYLTGEDTLTKKVYIIPFMDSVTEIDMTGMAKDAEDSTLTYKVMSTAFLPEDYEIDESGMLTMKDYSIGKGSFTVAAYDSMGAYCSFTVKVVTVNVGLWTIILLGVAAIIVAGVFGILLWIALNKPFAGSCYAQSAVDGVYSQWSEVRKARGRVKLAQFGIPLPQGISGTAYLQASGKNYVTLVSKTPFYCRGQMVKEMKVTSFDIEIRSDANSMDAMWIHFNGRMR